ncbi:hypothetical protein [Actinomadura sp. 6N118]|uniref:hypothetical protein n=1 Tax=Actinomadura sp. 6N118 TaxID=3375151 RepID=UPI0037ADAB1B
MFKRIVTVLVAAATVVGLTSAVSPAASGWNCAVMVKRPGHARYNDKVPMYLQIMNSRWAEDRQKNNVDTDQGNFRRYAGPVKVQGKWKGKGLCISIFALYEDAEANGQKPEWNGRLHKTKLACRA